MVKGRPNSKHSDDNSSLAEIQIKLEDDENAVL